MRRLLPPLLLLLAAAPAQAARPRGRVELPPGATATSALDRWGNRSG